jgi:hypothetical protein
MVQFRKLTGGLIPIIAGVVLGMVMGMMQMLELEPVNIHVDTQPFQNFALYMGLAVGLVFGFIAFVIFMALYKRFQYPASSRLGAWLGTAAGALLCCSTNLILNVSAASYDYVPQNAAAFIFNSMFFSLVGGVAGLVTGYFMAEIGARNLHYR